MYSFGSGIMYGTALTDASGAAITTPTPVPFGTLQDVSLDISFNKKELYGSLQFPVAIGRGTAKIGGKAKFATMNGAMLNNIFFGQTLNNGIESLVRDIAGVAIPTTPYQITPTPPSSGTWAADLGVLNASGVPMTKVTGTPTTGQYAAAAGVYTFAAADTGLVVFISYTYTATSTSAKKQTVVNQTLGTQPTFAMDLMAQYNGKQVYFHLYQCIADKLSFATKLEDFLVQQLLVFIS